MEMKQDTVKSRAAQCPVCGAQYPASYGECPYCGGVPLQTKNPKAGGGKRVQQGGKRTAPVSWEVPHPRGGESQREPEPGPKPPSKPQPKKRPEPVVLEPEEKTRGSRVWLVIRVILRILSLLIIAAAVYIVATKAIPFAQQMQSQRAGQQTQQEATPGENAEDPGTAAPDGTDAAAAPGDAAVQVALTETEITIEGNGQTHTLVPDLTPIDPAAALTWTSSNPAVASVNEQGVVTALSPGTSTITVTLANGASATCLVRCSWTVESTSTHLSLNRVDFTLFSQGENFQLAVIGTKGEATWSIADESVATITPSGVVTAQNQGVTVVTAQVDGESLTCTVRCRLD